MMAEPFIWGQGGQKLSPSQVAKYRALEDAMMARTSKVAQNPWEGLAQLTGAFSGTMLGKRADETEAAERSLLADALMGGDYKAVLGSEWASPQQSALASALMQRELTLADRADQRAFDLMLRNDDRSYEEQQRAAELAREDAIYKRDRKATLSDFQLQQNTPEAQADLASAMLDNRLKELEIEQTLNPVAAPAEPFTLSPGEIRFDGNGQQIATGGERPAEQTALMQNLAAAGLQPGTPEYEAAILKGTQQGVTVVNGDNSGAFLKKADELAATRLGEIVTSGQSAQQMMGDIQTLGALGAQLETGAGAQFMAQVGPFAQALGINVEGLSEAQAYQSIVDRMAPQMRPAGSGASSDFDARQFLSSLPSLGKTPEGNQIISETLTAMQQHKIAAAEIAGLAFTPPEQGGISWQEAEKRIRELPDPYSGFNEYRKRAEVAPSASADSSIDYNAPEPPENWGGDHGLWRFMSPEDRALW